jgi:predicted membrane protein
VNTRAAIALGLEHRPVAGLFGMLVAVALGLNLIFLTHSFLGIPEWTGFRFAMERSVPEVVGYVFTAWAAGLALYLAVAHRQAVLAGWSAVFAVLLADDYFMLHERMAKVVSANVTIPYPYGQPVGELVWLAFIGGVLLTAIAVAYRYAAPEWRAASRVLTALLALLVLCGVGIDAVHGFTTNRGVWHVILSALEDGGEVLLLAVVVTFLYGLAFCGHRSTPETLTRQRTAVRA